MTHGTGEKPLYYAKDGFVWKRPIETKTEGGTRISIGFPVCEMHDACAGQAQVVADLMNLGEAAQSGTEADLRKQIADLGAEVARLSALRPAKERSYQARVQEWMQNCFGAEISADIPERCHRFLEEALELVQSLGCAAHEAHQLVDYTFARPKGETYQEVGGVRVTLAALCEPVSVNEDDAAEAELARVWTKIDKIRAKQASKPKHSPLPESAAVAVAGTGDGEPDFFYDPEDWEATYERDIVGELLEGIREEPPGNIKEIACLKRLPSRYAANIVTKWHEGEPDDWDVKLFPTREEAEAAVKANVHPAPSKGGQ